MLDEQLFSLLDDGLGALGWAQERAALAACRERYEAGQYFVAFIGQYSAGKSYLINNLLGRDLLPQGRVETTPLLTYIRYGAEEGARLCYLDGRTEEVPLSEVRTIIQNGDGGRWGLAAVEHMEISIASDLLRQGMILLDTPGVNTVIERHERLLAQSLALASSILYVTHGTPSAVDMDKLELLAHGGGPLSFVRTHCDEINEAEERYADVVAAEERILVDFGIMERLDERFYISNLPDSPYFSGIASIRAMLEEKGADVRASLAEDTARRLHVMAHAVVEALGAQEEILAAGEEERAAEIRQRQEVLEREARRLETLLNERQEHLRKEADACQKEIVRDLRQYIGDAAERAAEHIAATGAEVRTDEQMRAALQREMQQILRSAYERIGHHVDPLLRGVNAGEIPTEMALPALELPAAEHYAALVEEQDSRHDDLQRQLAHLQANRAALEEELAQYDPAELSALDEELQGLEREIAAACDEYQELGSYRPQMVVAEEADTSGAEIGRRIGNILDWAMILVPVAGEAKGATTALANAPKAAGALAKVAPMTAKVSAVLSKGQPVAKAVIDVAKIRRVGAAAVKTVGQAARMAKEGAKAALTAEEVKAGGIKVLQKYKELKDLAEGANAPASLLSWLTLEYWGEQIGRQFDHPPRYRENLAYRAEFQANKRRLEQEMRRKKEALYRIQLERGRYADERQRKQALRESLEIDAQELEREIEARAQEWHVAAEKKVRQEWKRACAKYCREQLKKHLAQALEEHLADLSARLTAYQASRFLPLEERLRAQRDACDALLKMPPGEAEEKLRRIRHIRDALQKAMEA